MAITLAELRTQARQMADMEQSQFVQDPELNNYINFAIAELYDLLVGCYGSDYFLSSTTGTTTADVQDYALPTDFYKMRGVDIKITDTKWAQITDFNFNERNKIGLFAVWTLANYGNIRYRVMGGNIKFLPTPSSTVTYRLWYIPVATKLVADSDTLNDLNQYSDYVIITAAMKMLHKEESDITAMASERNRIIKRIEDTAQNRDAGESESITDIYSSDDYYYVYNGIY